MAIISEAEHLALSLPMADRGRLVSKLIESFGDPFQNEPDDLIELSLRRDVEMDQHPETIMSEDEFRASIEEFRRP